MDIEDIRRKRCLLELKLTELLQKESEQFDKETGISINKINVQYVDITTFKDRSSIFTIGNVTLELEQI